MRRRLWWAPAVLLSGAVSGCADHRQPVLGAEAADFQQIVLDRSELEALLLPVSGEGGFQDLLRELAGTVDRSSGRLRLDAGQAERIRRCAFDYGNGSWESRLLTIFARHLGPRLDRRVAPEA